MAWVDVIAIGGTGLLLWLPVAVVLLVGLHRRTILALWREPVVNRPVVIFESDDWGVGPESDAAALNHIAEILARYRDDRGQKAVMTLGVVGGCPDGRRILECGLRSYYRRTLDEPQFAGIVEAIRSGCQRGVFSLQLHGLEHCWPGALLSRVQIDPDIRCWLADSEARSETLPPDLQSRWVDTSRLPSATIPPHEIATAVVEEAVLVARVFGSVPTVAVPNTFVWSEDVEAAWVKVGITCIVTPGQRSESRDVTGAIGPPTKRIRNGESSASGVRQVVRDEYFEPIRGHRADRVWQAVARKTRQGRPTLLETHRANFIAAADIAEDAFEELDRALGGLLERHPDALFMSTAELVQHLTDPGSKLCECTLGLRLTMFFCRLECETELGRFLKLSGLKWFLGLVPVAGTHEFGALRR